MRDPAAAQQTDFLVDGETCSVHSAQDKQGWKAWGSFRGQHFRTTACENERSALAAWQCWAEFQANE